MAKKKWIQGAISRKGHGALRETVEREYGSRGFDQNGDIKVAVLHRIARSPHHTATTRKRARLAITLRRLGR
jgi:hypothetical protein